MDLRNFPNDFDAEQRVSKRRSLIEEELQVSLSALQLSPEQIGHADEQNCEHMFGAVPVPVGLAGPLSIHYGSGEVCNTYVPLATTEGALVASVNRGCKAISNSGEVHTSSRYVGITRSLAFESTDGNDIQNSIQHLEPEWKKVAEATSAHLKIISYEIDRKDDVVFLTIAADTDEAMGMNMVTIAAHAIGMFLSEKLEVEFLTVAGNVDSDKKPSTRSKKMGRGYRVKAEAFLSEEVIGTVLKTDVDALLKTARAKLEIGSAVAGALGANLQVANVVAAIYLATGQVVAHVVEGSLADTRVSKSGTGVRVETELSSLLVGVRGGGTQLPAQKQCLDLLLHKKTTLKPTAQLCESIGAAVLAGEVSLLAALSANALASAHRNLARKK